MNENLARDLRRGADYLQDLHHKEHGKDPFKPWYISAMREAAGEIEKMVQLANDERWELIRLLLGASEETLRKAVELAEEAKTRKNEEPLTEKELEEMDGKPVFVVHGGVGRWFICCDTLRMISGCGAFYRSEPREAK